MRVLLRILGGFLGLVLVAVLAALVFVFFVTRPKLSGLENVRGLRGEVRIERDRWGVPHITASASDADALFALGLVHAQDRLWQMEFQRRVAQGRLSEVLGEAALDKDKFLRTWGFYHAAEQALPALSPRSRSLLSAYTAGVNAAIAQDYLPLEFRLLRFRPERWTDVDSLAWQKLMAYDLGGNWNEELTGQRVEDKLGRDGLGTLYPPYPPGAPTILSREDLRGSRTSVRPKAGVGVALSAQTRQALAAQLRAAAQLGLGNMPDKGSNNWVISGRFTKSGKPLLANDPHLSLQAPMLWYLAELRGPTLHVIGATIPGLPGVVIGRNDRLAWGVTNTNPDVQDLFLEPEGAALSQRTEIIKVKGRPDVRLTVEESEHGPIISGHGTGAGGKGTQRLALQWTALQPGDTTMDAFLGLNYAQNWTDFVSALRAYVAPMQNFVYADVDGNIGYYAPGKVPVRNGWSGRLPVKGSEKRWTGYVPFDDLPHVYNPPEGLIVTANNKVTPQGEPDPLGPSSNWAPPYRAERILSLLEGKKSLSVGDMAKVQNDVLSPLWADLKPLMLSVKPTDERAELALDALRKWDGVQTQGSVASTVFAAWYSQLATMANDELGQGGYWSNPLFIVNELKTDGRFCRDAQAHIDNCAQLLSTTLQTAVDHLRSEIGPGVDTWRWGRVHRTSSNHGALGGVGGLGWLWNRSTAAAGGLFTVNVGSYDLDSFRQTLGPSYRQIVDLAQPDASRFIGTLGQSGNPLSGHYADQQDLWRTGQYLPMSSQRQDWGSTTFLILQPAK